MQFKKKRGTVAYRSRIKWSRFSAFTLTWYVRYDPGVRRCGLVKYQFSCSLIARIVSPRSLNFLWNPWQSIIGRKPRWERLTSRIKTTGATGVWRNMEDHTSRGDLTWKNGAGKIRTQKAEFTWISNIDEYMTHPSRFILMLSEFGIRWRYTIVVVSMWLIWNFHKSMCDETNMNRKFLQCT